MDFVFVAGLTFWPRKSPMARSSRRRHQRSIKEKGGLLSLFLTAPVREVAERGERRERERREREV